MSSFACFMTNAGHVDPGYEGPLRFTIINLGREDYQLRTGDFIFVLMLVRLSNAASAGWLSRNPTPGGEPLRRQMRNLAKDFLDVDERAKAVAKREADSVVKQAQLALETMRGRWKIGTAIVGAIITGVILLIQTFHPLAARDYVDSTADEIREDVRSLQNRVAALGAMARTNEIERDLQLLRERLNSVEQKSKGDSSPRTDAGERRRSGVVSAIRSRLPDLASAMMLVHSGCSP